MAGSSNRMNDIDRQEEAVGEWANAQFPLSTDQSRIAHLKKELAELEEAVALDLGDDRVLEEVADIIMICMHLSYNRRPWLSVAIENKLATVKQRRYPDRPGPDGVVEHIRGDD